MEVTKLIPAIDAVKAGLFGHAIPTPAAWSWTRRNHKRELEQAGALISGSGRRPDLIDPRMADLIAAIAVGKGVQV